MHLQCKNRMDCIETDICYIWLAKKLKTNLTFFFHGKFGDNICLKREKFAVKHNMFSKKEEIGVTSKLSSL